MGLDARNMSLGFPTEQDSNLLIYREQMKIEISPVASFEMLLSLERITKALIRLPRMRSLVCTFVVRKPLKTGFSRVEA